MTHQINLAERRAGRMEALTGDELDVLVVGGGIVGAGIARDAAMRGLRVGLAEQHDLAFGTSSRSSRLLHGGLRYLAQGRIGLVYEASREKRVLARIVPHLAEPLPFVFPTYRASGWPLWKLRLGVKLYDLLCGGRNLGPSTSMSRPKTLEHLPSLRSEDLTGAVRYYDALSADARLVLDTLRSADSHGATVLNYLRLEGAAPDGGRWQCQVHDVLADQTRPVRARSVVNATGPWAEKLPYSSIRLRLTKGVHLVVDRGRLPIPDAVVITRDRRILFAIPWGLRVILGTTDTDYDGPIEAVRTEPADVRYILEAVDRAFPRAQLGEADVISTWAGLRPLIAGKPGEPSDVSRAHQIRMPVPGWFDVAGGKLTTYRLIAEQVVDRLARHLQRKTPPCRTAVEPLVADALGGGLSTSPRSVRGQETRARGQETRAQHKPPSGVLPPEVSREAVEYYCQSEWAVHLDDVMLRRTSWHSYHPQADEIAHKVAAWMVEIFGWDPARREAELARYRQSVT